MNIEFKKISEFHKNILVELLKDGYSFDKRIEERDLKDWKDFDDFFFNNLDIADKYGFITTLNDEPIGFISWDPRNMPKYAEIGYNCIITKYKGNGYGKLQLNEAINRIKKNKVKKIIVTTDEDVIPAYEMYESVGFKLINKRPIKFVAGGNLDYEYKID